MRQKIEAARRHIAEKLTETPTIGLILGSGLGILAEEIESPTMIPYDEIPHFPVSTVEGHAGRFVIGRLEGKPVIAMQGRFHYYEGYDMKEVTFPVRVMKALGVERLIVTNAAGGVNESYLPGDLMLITDHLNMSGDHPLRGKNEAELGPRFPDASDIYDRATTGRIFDAALREGIRLQRGVYCFNQGPSYETPAEVRMARVLGADAVGMSTVPEALVASHAGMKVTGISCITNMAAGILDQPLDHHEVVETADRVKSTFIDLVRMILRIL